MQPKEMDAGRMSVGAATWDGAFVMLAYLGALFLDQDHPILYYAMDDKSPGFI